MLSSKQAHSAPSSPVLRSCDDAQGISAVVPDESHQDAPSPSNSPALIAAREVLEGSGAFHQRWVARLSHDETITLADLYILSQTSQEDYESLNNLTRSIDMDGQVVQVTANLYINQLEIKYSHDSNTDEFGFFYQPSTQGSTPFIVPAFCNGRCDGPCAVCDTAPNRRFPHDNSLEYRYRHVFPDLNTVLRWCADAPGCYWGTPRFFAELEQFEAMLEGRLTAPQPAPPAPVQTAAAAPPPPAPVQTERCPPLLQQIFSACKKPAPSSYAAAAAPNPQPPARPIATNSGLTGGARSQDDGPKDDGSWTPVKAKTQRNTTPKATPSVPRPASTAHPLFGSDAEQWCRKRLGHDFIALKQDHTAQCIKCPGDIHTSRKLYVGYGEKLVSHSLKDSKDPEESDFIRIYIDNLDSNPAPLRDFAEIFAAVGTAVIDVYRPTFQDASGKWIFKPNCVVKIPKAWAPRGSSDPITADLVLHILREHPVIYRGKALRFQFFSR